MTLPGSLLLINDAPSNKGVYKITLEMLPLQHAGHVENFADNFGEGWFDSNQNQLRLQFNFVSMFRNGEIEDFWISVSSALDKIAFAVARAPSPGVGQKHSEIPWSGQSRFAVDEVVNLPDWAINSAKFELMVGVAGKAEKVGIIHVEEVSKELNPLQTSFEDTPEVAVPATLAPIKSNSNSAPGASKVASRTMPMKFGVSMKYFSWIIKRVTNMDRLFLLAVVIPTLISSIYFGLIATDVYISESHFVVRSPQHQAISGLGALFQGSSFSQTQNDTYSVHDFIFSRDALKQLNDELGVVKAFSRNDVDIFSRFAGLDWDSSFESLYRYYQKHVTVDLDTSSSISTLNVYAFTADDAFRINSKLLEMSENLVNQLNERGRQDLISFSSSEVAIAEKKAKASALAVSDYRNQKSVFDPEKQSALQLQQISKLQEELIATKIQLAQIRALSRDNPQITSLQMQIETLQTEIDAETAKVAGGDHSLASKSIEYEGLILERDFAGKQLATALSSLEQARNDALSKQLYLERIVEPSKPDKAMEPKRIRNVFATFVLGLIAWGILTMLLAGVREHQD